MRRLALAGLLVFLAAGAVHAINANQHPWVVETTPLYKGHSPNLPNAVVCVEQKFEDGVNVGREKVVPVDDVSKYKQGDPCPAG